MTQGLREVFVALQTVKQKEDDIAGLRVELALLQREIDAWKQMGMDYFAMLQRGIEQYGEEDPRGMALLRDAEIFARFCAGRGLERITATAGDPLVTELYQVIDEEASTAVAPGAILCCEEWGYRSGTEVYKRARVVLAKAPENMTATDYGSEAAP